MRRRARRVARGARRGDARAIHRLRVATRRLREALPVAAELADVDVGSTHASRPAPGDAGARTGARAGRRARPCSQRSRPNAKPGPRRPWRRVDERLRQPAARAGAASARARAAIDAVTPGAIRRPLRGRSLGRPRPSRRGHVVAAGRRRPAARASCRTRSTTPARSTASTRCTRSGSRPRNCATRSRSDRARSACRRGAWRTGCCKRLQAAARRHARCAGRCSIYVQALAAATGDARRDRRRSGARWIGRWRSTAGGWHARSHCASRVRGAIVRCADVAPRSAARRRRTRDLRRTARMDRRGRAARPTPAGCRPALMPVLYLVRHAIAAERGTEVSGR